MKKILTVSFMSILLFSAGPAVFADEETVTAQDLGVKDPTLLPDSPLYIFKELGQKIKLFFTFDQFKKAQLENTYANQKILELKKLSEKEAKTEVINLATKKYERAMEQVKARADKIKEKSAPGSDVDKFLQKFTDQQILQEKILQKLEGQVPESALQKIKDARETHLEKFKEVMEKLEEKKENIAEKLQDAAEKNPEIMEKIKEKVACFPVCKLIGTRSEGWYNSCNGNLMKYANCGNQNYQKCSSDGDCPQMLCQPKEDGTVSENCQKNRCINGECKLEPYRPIAECKELWWFDKTSTACGQKKFCGAYMYFGLQTFDTEDACKSALLTATVPPTDQ